ncbi:MAG: hypothetical protein ARM1_0101 [Candidatus Micrarchaeota archaeon]|nr:MAG: hypothetical protein ARM1_0101 [Candidatus Micrarchaeota archaeon]
MTSITLSNSSNKEADNQEPLIKFKRTDDNRLLLDDKYTFGVLFVVIYEDNGKRYVLLEHRSSIDSKWPNKIVIPGETTEFDKDAKDVIGESGSLSYKQMENIAYDTLIRGLEEELGTEVKEQRKSFNFMGYTKLEVNGKEFFAAVYLIYSGKFEPKNENNPDGEERHNKIIEFELDDELIEELKRDSPEHTIEILKKVLNLLNNEKQLRK